MPLRRDYYVFGGHTTGRLCIFRRAGRSGGRAPQQPAAPVNRTVESKQNNLMRRVIARWRRFELIAPDGLLRRSWGPPTTEAESFRETLPEGLRRLTVQWSARFCTWEPGWSSAEWRLPLDLPAPRANRDPSSPARRPPCTPPAPTPPLPPRPDRRRRPYRLSHPIPNMVEAGPKGLRIQLP